MNCRAVVEAAVPVYDVETPDEAVRIAISKTGEMLNPDLNYVEIDMGERSCPHCGDTLEPAFIAADESLVALELEMTVFNVEREEHASRIARKEIGQRLENIPLEVLEIEQLDEDEEDADEEDTENTASTVESTDEASSVSDDSGPVDEATESIGTPASAESEESTAAAGDDTETGDTSTVTDDDDEILPEFEELIDE